MSASIIYPTNEIHDVQYKVIAFEEAKKISTYDRLGRLFALALPDFSPIFYIYDAGCLREVNRSSCSPLYHYALFGKVYQLQLMNNVGEISYQYDRLELFWREIL
jgi:hypothetical protein